MKRIKKWEKLDNTAKLFPVISSEDSSSTYRISVVLKEEVIPELLQKALDIVLPKFPGFNRRLRAGIFWYYLEENGKPAPRIYEEREYPCRYIFPQRNNSYLFRVTYYEKRINLEVFHVLADGTGGISFLKELCYQYLRLAKPELSHLPDRLYAGTSLDLEDSFLRNYKSFSKSPYKRKKAYIVKGEKLPYKGFGVIQGYMNIGELKKIAKEKYGVSINQYLIGAFTWGLYLSNQSKVTKERAIRVCVPVNLRSYYESNTQKNFFVMVASEFVPNAEDNTFENCLMQVKNSLNEQVKKENLEKILAYNVGNEMVLINKMFPLPIKNLAMNIVYRKNAGATTSTVTNIGNIDIAEEYKDYIRSFYCFIAFSKGQEIKATITSYGDELTFSIVSAFSDTAVQKIAFSQMASDGAKVNIETNGVF